MRDALFALDVGVHDFMTKPFRFEELLARVRARVQMRDKRREGDESTGGRPTDGIETAPRESAGPQSDAVMRRDAGWRGS
jgi:DNA-binding response OmpR family regulator